MLKNQPQRVHRKHRIDGSILNVVLIAAQDNRIERSSASGAVGVVALNEIADLS